MDCYRRLLQFRGRMKGRLTLLTLLYIAALCFPAHAQEARNRLDYFNANILLGETRLDQDSFKPMRNLPTFAIEMDEMMIWKGITYNFFGGIAYSMREERGFIILDDGGKRDHINWSMIEFYLGSRKYFSPGTDYLRFYLNAGCSFLYVAEETGWGEARYIGEFPHGDFEITEYKYKTSAFALGAIYGGGLILKIPYKGGAVNLGVDIRKMTATQIDLDSGSGPPDYLRVMFVIGGS